jgi:Dolichyl-phosphate-mannose-protein mannosyltransferase
MLKAERMTAFPKAKWFFVPLGSMAVSSPKTMPTPTLASVERRAGQPQAKDPWLVATFLTSCITSIVSLWYFFHNHQILLIGDTYSHVLIARRLLDNLTPGVAQLGGIWLPLPHLLMLPFIWNDYLWRTGLAGSFVSMPCYATAALYLFLAARRLTHNSPASFVGTLLFILNPNILYLQATPLSELVLITALVMAVYYFLAWAQEDKLKYLVWAAAATFLATLARYDAWLLLPVFLFLIAVIGKLKHLPWAHIESNLLAFGSLGGLGIVLWLLWCGIIFGDPLYFQHSSYSSQGQQQNLIRLHLLFTYHNLWQSLRTFALDSMLNVGAIAFVLATVAVVIFYLRRRITPDMLAASAFLVPFAFYVLSLYTGQAALFVPGASPSLAHTARNLTNYNARYGAQMVAPAAFFLSTLVARWPRGRANIIPQVILSVTIVAQSIIITASGGIISLQEGQYGLDCAQLHPLVVYLAEHYTGGRILEDTYSAGTYSLDADVGVDFKNVIYEGSGEFWDQALRNPAVVVDWVIANPRDGGDPVARHINVASAAFLSQFSLVAQEAGGLSLYHRNGLPPLPTRPVSPDLLTMHRLCGGGATSDSRDGYAITLSSNGIVSGIRLAPRGVWKAGQQ